MVFFDQLKNDYLDHAKYLLRNIVEIEDKGFFPGGNNGPYMHIETPVRNTCHIIVLFCKAYELSANEDYKSAIDKFVRYLLSSNYYINNQYIHRRGGTDTCNGVIGDAWVIEGLSKALPYLNLELRNQVHTRLDDIVNRIHFNEKEGFAYRFDSLKGPLGGDFTYNHQLWLMASLAQAGLRQDVVIKFLDASLSGAFKTRSNGIINHLFHGGSLKNLSNRMRYRLLEMKSLHKIEYKERGYHLFNMFAFAILYNKVSHEFFDSDIFSNALAAIDYVFLENLFEEDNKYSVHYNSPAFELSYIYSTFSNSALKLNVKDSGIEAVYGRNKSQFWSAKDQAYTCNTIDCVTFMARVYELSYAL